MAQDDEQDDAARAFEDLTAEVRVMRRAVEALEAKKPVDYAPTLAALTQELERLIAATTAMARRPAVALTPESYAAQLRRATDEAARPAAAELQRVQTLTSTLERALGGIRTREEQRRWVWRAVIGGMVGGVFIWALLLLPMARMLPESWHLPEKLAAGVVGADRWTAGERMMASYGPDAWNRIVRAAELEKANREVLDACRRNAARTRRSQRCAIKVDPPAPPHAGGGRGGAPLSDEAAVPSSA